MECLFCRIVAREVPASLVLEDERVLAFRDTHPAAPVHVLVVPKKHVANVAEAAADDALLMGQVLLAGGAVAEQAGLARTGYRLVFNVGRDAGQHVAHVHLHVLGGRAMSWPPG